MREFSHRVTATAADIDELDHVSNLVYVRWILEVALAHSRAVGWTHDDYLRLGAVFVVRRHEIDYLQQVVVGDDVEVATWVDSWKLASCVRRTAIRRGGVEVARGATTWAFMDLVRGRPIKIPDELRIAFGIPDGHSAVSSSSSG